jgi:hypothetical protein
MTQDEARTVASTQVWRESNRQLGPAPACQSTFGDALNAVTHLCNICSRRRRRNSTRSHWESHDRYPDHPSPHIPGIGSTISQLDSLKGFGLGSPGSGRPYLIIRSVLSGLTV